MTDQPADIATLVRLASQALVEIEAVHTDLRAVIATAQRVESKMARLVGEMRAARA